MTIKITRYTKAKDKGCLIAWFSMSIDVLISNTYTKMFYINDCKWWQKEGVRWISFPDKEYVKDGQKKYSPICGFEERNDMEAFQCDVNRALEEYCLKYKLSQPIQSVCEIKAYKEPDDNQINGYSHENEEIPF